MKSILTLGFIALFSASLNAQTQMIAHRSHSGKNKNFKINGWTNLGLGYTQEDLRRMSQDRFEEQSVNLSTQIASLEQDIELNNARSESAEKKNYAKSLSSMQQNLEKQSTLLDQITDLLEEDRIIDSTINADNNAMYAQMRELQKAGETEKVEALQEDIRSNHQKAFNERNKRDKQRYALEQKYGALSMEFNKMEFASRSLKLQVEALDDKNLQDVERTEQVKTKNVPSVMPKNQETELEPMTKEDKKAQKRLRRKAKKADKKQKKADKKYGNKALGTNDITNESPNESGVNWWFFLLVIIIPAAFSAIHGAHQFKSK